VLLATADLRDAAAQDMRVYTTVRAVGENRQNSPILAESLTLYHAGKMYDYMENVGEVMIFEPEQHRFTLLGANYIGATVTFAEIQQFLNAARGEAENYLSTPAPDAGTRQLIAGLRFQLSPRFKEELRSDRLRLVGDILTYDVKTEAPPEGAPWKAYLDYTDWAARLNYLMHPQSLLPESRLKLNERLREHKRLPVQVVLTARLDTDLHLRAEHRYGWALQPIDRQFIDQWERKRESASIRWVSLHEYHKELLTKASASGK
jgi:hypothetical protein